MAVIDGRLVYRDGANVSGAPATSYQIADDFSGYFQGASGDLLHVKSAKGLWMSDGTSWIPIYTTMNLPPPPTSLPPAPLNVLHLGVTTYYNLSDANDVVSFYSPTSDSIVTLHNAVTAKVKPYYLKSWGGYNLYVRTIAGNYIDAAARTEIILKPDATLCIVPLTGHPYWAIL